MLFSQKHLFRWGNGIYRDLSLQFNSGNQSFPKKNVYDSLHFHCFSLPKHRESWNFLLPKWRHPNSRTSKGHLTILSTAWNRYLEYLLCLRAFPKLGTIFVGRFSFCLLVAHSSRHIFFWWLLIDNSWFQDKKFVSLGFWRGWENQNNFLLKLVTISVFL